MSGYESNRFIDLSEREAKYLICIICQNILNNAIKNDCEHTFCKSCVENLIESNGKECPECMTQFTTRKRTSRMRSDLNLVIVSNFVFKNNLTANNMINELKIKCNYESNGCQQVVQLASLSEHLKNCKHWLCPKCKFFDKYEGHDCFERMKTDRNRLNVKLNEIESKNSLLEEENKTLKISEVGANNKLRDIESQLKSSEIKNLKLENQLNEINLKVWLPDLKNVWKKETTLSAQCIYFGTYLSPYSTLKFSFNFRNTLIGFEMKPKNSEDYKNYTDFFFRIRAIEEFKFCADNEFPVIIIKLKSLKSCDKIREVIQLSEPSKGWFDIESKDIKERYIIIKVCPQTTIGYIIIGCMLSVTGYIGTPLKSQSIDVNDAKLMFSRVSNNEDSDSNTKQDSDSEEEEISPISSSKRKVSVSLSESTPGRHPANNE